MRGRQYAGQAELNVNFNMAPFCDVQRFKPGKDVESHSSAALVEQALLPAIRLDLLPKASIDVYITVLDMDTSTAGCVALAVTAASAALAEAGIEMYGLVAGATAVRGMTDAVCYPFSAVQRRGPAAMARGSVAGRGGACECPSYCVHDACSGPHDVLFPARPCARLWKGARGKLLFLIQVSNALVEATSKLHSITAQALYKLS